MTTLAIIEAKYIGGYVIDLLFSDDSRRRIDFEHFLTSAKHPLTRSYLNLDKFTQFKLVNGDLDWNDYELCVPLAQLYRGELRH